MALARSKSRNPDLARWDVSKSKFLPMAEVAFQILYADSQFPNWPLSHPYPTKIKAFILIIKTSVCTEQISVDAEKVRRGDRARDYLRLFISSYASV